MCEQRDSLQQQVSQLDEKLVALKQLKKAEEQKLSELQQHLEQLEPIKEKYSALQSETVILKARYEECIQKLEKNQDRSSPVNFTEEVSLNSQCFSSPFSFGFIFSMKALWFW